MTLPARRAREAARLDAVSAAKHLRIGIPYLLRLEREGGWPVHLAERAARVYGCDEKTLLFPTPGREVRRGKRGKPQGRRSTVPGAGRVGK